ncbi:MAG: type II secretion system protein GspD [Planctomycetota bacterium JB042]
MRISTLCLVLALAPVRVAAPQAGMPGDERVTMSLEETDLSSVLKTFALEYRVSIVAGADVTRKVTMNFFDVPVEEALRAVLSVNGYTFRKDGPFYVVERPAAAVEAPAAAPELESAVVWLDYLTASEALKLVEPLKSADGKIAATTDPEQGIPSDPTEAGGNRPAGGEALMVVDRPEVVRRIRDVLAELDRRPRQVLVEATILEVRLDDETKLGVDFNTLSGIDFTDLAPISNLNTLSLGPALAPEVAAGFEVAGTAGFASDLNTDGLHLGYVTDDIAVFVEALERVTDTTVLANPRVLCVDRQRAEIIIGAKLGYLTATTTETATVQEVEFLDIGTQLRFRPFISSDGFVRLEIHPENSAGQIDSVSGLPSETTTEVTTNVLVRDGNTIAIGGLISDQVDQTTKQVPGLGSIPYLGALFRQTVDKVTRREVIVLLTPHIVDGGAIDEEALELADAMANGRDLLFSEHLPISRQRLARPYLLEAERLLDDGQVEQALRSVEVALELAPTDVGAARLRRRALAALGVEDEEVRALLELEGIR